MSSRRLGRLLVVDDETELLNTLCEVLAGQGYQAVGATSGKDALAALREQPFDLLLTDLIMPGMDGIALLRSALEIDPHLVGVIMTGQATVQTAVEAMKVGAFDYVLKPFKLTVLLPVLDRAIEVRRLRLENVQLRETVAIYELSTAIAYTLDPNTLANKTVEAALQQLDADEASLMLPTREGDALYVAAVCGHDRERLLGERVPLGQGVAGWVAQNREMLILDGEVDDPGLVALHPRSDIFSSISMPLLARDRLVGVLNVSVTSCRRRFTLGQVRGLGILASVAATALESALLYAQVREGEAKYHSIFNNAVEGIFQSLPDERFITANPALARMLGYDSPEELIASVTEISHQLCVDPDRHADVERLLQQRDQVEGFESQVYRKDGSTTWISENVRAVRNDSGTLLYNEGAVEDISQRKRVEEALRESEERYRDLFEDSPVALKVEDFSHVKAHLERLRAGGVQDFRAYFGNHPPAVAECAAMVKTTAVNKAALELFKAKTVEELGDDLSRIFCEETYSVFTEELVAIAEGRTRFETETVSQTLMGDKRQIALTWFVVPGYEETLSQVMVHLTDITERKRAEEEKEKLQAQLLQAQKMEAVGQVTASIAHDFNNMLTAINGFAELTQLRMSPDDPLQPNMKRILEAGRNAADLVRQLMAFSRQQVMEMKVVDLNAAVTGMCSMLQRMIGEHIQLETQLSGDLWSARVDPVHLQQVIVNLAVNARDAMPRGGRVTIETANVTLDELYAATHPDMQPGEHVALIISDTGCGMSPEVKARIFEPFFTTKGPGRGTGLGLSTVYGIVKQSGGHIHVNSEVGVGTTFKVYLPRTQETVEAAALTGSEAGAVSGGETILLVEDEEAVRLFAHGVLKLQGYQVFQAGSAEEALRLSQEWADPIHLLLADVVMTGMGGEELAQQLTHQHPGLRVLFMSGYSSEAIEHNGLLRPGVAFVQKPFTALDLARKVRQALDASAS